MRDNKNIKAILFDSGRVLNYPRTGHWFMPPNFHEYVNKELFESLDKDLIEKAFYKGLQYLEKNNLILTESQELGHFVEFYRILSKELPALGLNEMHISEIAKDTVYNDDKFFFYEDVFKVIPELSKRYKLGIISDTWPSLERVFKNVALRDYFSTFIMSSVLGVNKPHELMFTTALSELNVSPEEALFIDDNISNVEGARNLGIQSTLMLREGNPGSDIELLCIHHLSDLHQLLER